MDISELQTFLQSVYDDVRLCNDGDVADYIPQLKKVNPDLFGICACTVGGDIVKIGDAEMDFCLQSCSKPLTYCIVREMLGRKKVHSHVGYEPSGRGFNAHVLNRDGLPHNPLINAGAIMIASLLASEEEPSHRFELIKQHYQEMCGHIGKIGFDNSVFLSEKQHADRNMSLAYYMRENGAFDGVISPNKIQEHLDLYFQCCSITVQAKMGAVFCSMLANGGVCPFTGKRLFSKETIKDCLTLMFGCGMYDYSGQFAFEIGLPAKSGVSGCIFLVVPNVMGVCIWSPRLDCVGNSVKGIEVCRRIVNQYNFHIFDQMVSNTFINNNNNNKSQDDSVLLQKIITAASNNDVDVIKQLSGLIDLNTGDYDGRTALHLACSDGCVDVVRYLVVEKGCCTDVKDRWGNTPLTEIKDKEGDEYDTIRGLLHGVQDDDHIGV